MRGREDGKKRVRIVWALGSLFVSTGAVAQDAPREWRGPIPIRNGRPYNQLALQFVPEQADVLRPGGVQFGAQLDVFNNLLVPAAIGAIAREDFEEQRLTLSYRRGQAGGSELAVFLPIRWRNGGLLDPLMKAWHNFFGVPDHQLDSPAGRNTLGDFHSVLQLTDRLGTSVVNVGNAFGPGDVTLTYKRALQTGRRSAWAARLGVKLPTGNPGLVLGSGTVGAGISLDGRYNVGPWWVAHANLSSVWSGGATRVPGARRLVNGYMLAAEYRPNGRDSWVLQSEGSGLAVVTGNRRADQSQATFTVGYQRALDRRNRLYASFSENGDWNDNGAPFFGNVGPDYTVTLGIIHRR